MIQFINVNKRYEHREVLEDINIRIEDGTILGLIGRNGAGKSTFLRLIAGVVEADAGIVAFNQQQVFDNPNVQKEVFFVSDDAYFMTKATIKEMRDFYKVFYKNFDDGRFYELLYLFDLDEDQSLNSFSKGMKRQVSLLLGIAARTKVLLLDEAFDGLDPLMRFKIRQMISDEVATNKTIVIISSHNLQELSDICDSVVILDKNTIQMNYSQEEFLNSYHKYQIAFANDIDPKVFTHIETLRISGKSRIFTLLVKGNRSEIEAFLETLNPILYEHDDTSLDEIFMAEVNI